MRRTRQGVPDLGRSPTSEAARRNQIALSELAANQEGSLQGREEADWLRHRQQAGWSWSRPRARR